MPIFDLDGYRYTFDLDPTWRPIPVPGAPGAWRAPSAWRGFMPNANLVHTVGPSARGAALIDEVVPPLLDELVDRMLIDVAFEGDDDLRLVISHRVDEHRVTLFQRILVHEQGSVTLSVTVPDMVIDRLRDAWTTPLRSLTREELAS